MLVPEDEEEEVEESLLDLFFLGAGDPCRYTGATLLEVRTADRIRSGVGDEDLDLDELVDLNIYRKKYEIN